MTQYLPLVATVVTLAALAWSIFAAKTDRARLEGSFSATVTANVSALSTRVDEKFAAQDKRFDEKFATQEKRFDEKIGDVKLAMGQAREDFKAEMNKFGDRMQTHGEKIAVLIALTNRGGGGEKGS